MATLRYTLGLFGAGLDTPMGAWIEVMQIWRTAIKESIKETSCKSRVKNANKRYHFSPLTIFRLQFPLVEEASLI
jgi:hypothetical protein